MAHLHVPCFSTLFLICTIPPHKREKCTSVACILNRINRKLLSGWWFYDKSYYRDEIKVGTKALVNSQSLPHGNWEVEYYLAFASSVFSFTLNLKKIFKDHMLQTYLSKIGHS